MRYLLSILMIGSLVVSQSSTTKYGKTLYNSNGTSTTKYGNTLYNSNGTSTTKYGNTFYNSNGTSTTKYGNTYYDSKGSSTTKYGNTYYNRDKKKTQSYILYDTPKKKAKKKVDKPVIMSADIFTSPEVEVVKRKRKPREEEA